MFRRFDWLAILMGGHTLVHPMYALVSYYEVVVKIEERMANVIVHTVTFLLSIASVARITFTIETSIFIYTHGT
jgi:hypothetical protein